MTGHRHENQPTTPTQTRRLSRRRLLQVAGAAGGGVVVAAGAGALYHALTSVAPPARLVGPPRGGYPSGQYQIAEYGVRVQPDAASGVIVEIPPVWNLVITATLTRSPGSGEQQRLENALRAVESAYPYSPSGVFMLVAYGLPYFRKYIAPAMFAAHLPRMADAKAAPVLEDAVRFPSDPPSLVLEENDILFHLRSDVLAHLQDVQRALFHKSGTFAGRQAADADMSDLFRVTSVRTGFVGAGLPQRMARQARLRFADKIPSSAPLFMGFTSSQQSGQAREVAVSFDGKPDPLLRPLTTARPNEYFAGGTALHISHLTEDLESWYELSYDERVARMFHLNAVSTPGRVSIQTAWLNPNTTQLDAEQHRVIGHNEAVQRGSRTPEGQAIQLRVDFNTMDDMDDMDGAGPTPGVHFLSFSAGSQIFHESRMGMEAADVVSKHPVPVHANGINAFIRATRRQNFLVPPRRHRAFPLLELL
jgi:hypothetical protein